MKITIDEIDSKSLQLIGFANLPSFIVHFRASTFDGIARFVPACDAPNECAGRQFTVEIAQESITDFRVLELPRDASIESLAAAGSFRVFGTVSFVLTPLEPVDSRFTFVRAGDATFTLGTHDTCGIQPDVGSWVTFIVDGMSFWDEAI